jgi:hypothetical protein
VDWETTEDNCLTTYIAKGYSARYCIQVERDRLGNEEIHFFRGRREYVKPDGTPISSVEEAKKLAEDDDNERFRRSFMRAARGYSDW